MRKNSGTLFSFLGIKSLSDKAFLLLAALFSSTSVCLVTGGQTVLYLKRISPAVDVAGRQRMLTQQMLARAHMLGIAPDQAAREGRQSLLEFDEALRALRHGGMAAGVPLLPAPAQVSPQLTDLEAAWSAFRPEFQWLLENSARHNTPASKERLRRLTEAAERQSAAAQAITGALRGSAMGRVHSVLLLFLVLAAATAALFYFSVALLHRRLLAPVEELAVAARDFGAGAAVTFPAGDGDDEIGELQRAFSVTAAAVARDRKAREITAALLTLGIADDSVDVFLGKALDIIFAIPWLTAEPRGAVLLRDEVSGTLSVKALRGPQGAPKPDCDALPAGRCLCGRAAATGATVFAGNLDERHEVTYAGIQPHGHYCVPMRHGGKVTGVLNIYLEAGHRRDEAEVSQLENIAGLLASIVERKRLISDSARMSEIIRQSSEAIFITGTDGKIAYVNEAFERATGFPATEAIGKKPNLLKSGEHAPEYYTEMWTNMQRGVPWSGRIVNRKKDGTFYTVQANIFPIKSGDGEAVSYVSMQQDISPLALMEEQLRQAQKMEAVGRLAGGVAHDFNNILMAIDCYARFLAPALRGNAQAGEDLAEVHKAVSQATGITRQLLAFSRKQKALFQPLKLGSAVLENEKMLRRMLAEGVTLKISAAQDAGTIKADPGQLAQVLMNLLVNARDAMPGGGEICVDVLRQSLPSAVLTPLGEIPAGEYSVLSVHDAGCGMDASTLSKIFDPFFTTKPKGKGTGLGLSIVHGIVQGHGAHLTVASRPGQGTTFTLYFPLLPETAEQASVAAAPAPVPAAIPAGTTVFLAEDDPTVIASLTRMLRALGAEVEPFQEPAKLLEFTAGFPGKPQLLLTDIVMPGMDGFALAEEFMRLKPGTPVIYMSGYTDPDVFRGRLDQPGIIFLYKPFSPEQLVETLGRALAAGQAA